jgi:hypothetical protein
LKKKTYEVEKVKAACGKLVLHIPICEADIRMKSHTPVLNYTKGDPHIKNSKTPKCKSHAAFTFPPSTSKNSKTLECKSQATFTTLTDVFPAQQQGGRKAYKFGFEAYSTFVDGTVRALSVCYDWLGFQGYWVRIRVIGRVRVRIRVRY